MAIRFAAPYSKFGLEINEITLQLVTTLKKTYFLENNSFSERKHRLEPSAVTEIVSDESTKVAEADPEGWLSLR